MAEKYQLIYDYVGENDTCMGITEDFYTWVEAHDAMKELNQNPDYCNFDIVSIGG